MEKCTITKEALTRFCKNNLHVHTDWTGTYVETQYKCNSVEKFVDNLWNFLIIEEENESRRLT